MATQTTEEPWAINARDFPHAGTPEQRYEFLLRYAILAPSTHNTQPWLFHVDHRGIGLHADPTRSLPVVDPDHRALIISCGAALGYLCVIARYFSYEPHVSYENTASCQNFLAHFSASDRCEPRRCDVAMFNAIPTRRTCRSDFDDKMIPLDVVRSIVSAASSESVTFDTITDLEKRRQIGRLVNEGDRLQGRDPSFRQELGSWSQTNRSGCCDGMPGYVHGFGNIPSMLGAWCIRSFDWGDGKVAAEERFIRRTPLLIAIKTTADGKLDWLNAGRALANLLLLATNNGLSVSYLNQPIEVESLRPALKEQLGNNGEPQLLLRIGYGQDSEPTPRRSVDDVVVRQPH